MSVGSRLKRRCMLRIDSLHDKGGESNVRMEF